MPILHCTQEIPCNPCSALCDRGLIVIEDNDICQVPTFIGNQYCCGYCEMCVAGCPGLAITLVDYRSNPDLPLVSIPYEFTRTSLAAKDVVTVLDTEGHELGNLNVIGVHAIPTSDRTLIVQVQAPKAIARQIAGLRIQEPIITQPMDDYVEHIEDDTIVCRCERVTALEIRKLIRAGYRDINEIKTVTRAGMGACGSKTCRAIINRLFREEGIPMDQVTEYTRRPMFIEVPLGVFAGVKDGEEKK